MKVLRVCVCVCVCKQSVISNAALRAIERTISLLQRGRRCHNSALKKHSTNNV